MTTYDEFSMFRDNAEEAGLAWRQDPKVERREVDVGPAQRVSALVWGESEPELVLIHGGAQNAHTWDTVALALDRPLAALDLPGHGHSSWREDGDYGPERNAAAMATAIETLAPNAGLVVGMSLGGLTALTLASRRPELVDRLLLVDVTPGVDHAKAKAIIDFVRGPEVFESFDAVLERTVRHNPTRSERSLRRGVLHNAKALPDGRWTWRYDQHMFRRRQDGSVEETVADEPVEFRSLWEHVARIQAPTLLCRGEHSPVVSDEDVEEMRRRLPTVAVETIAGAGHSIQGDRPLELARSIAEFANSPPA
jgi:pimeloyl-ACP methyl ester carboxylesterase